MPAAIIFSVSKRVKIGLGIALTLFIAAALTVFYRLDPAEEPIFPQCLFLLVTGHQCPGCGSQRAIHSLLHLDFGAAFRYNAMMVLAIPYVFLGVHLQYFGGSKRRPKLEKIFFGRWSALAVLFLIFTFWIGRNLF